jgi:hypothetical protein
MSTFSPDKSRLLSAIKRDFHSYFEASVRKGSKSPNDKRILKSKITAAIDAIDTTDFGIKVIVGKTLQ